MDKGTEPATDDRKRRPHLINGEFQSDKYPTCPRGKVPLSVKDKAAQDLLWAYAQRRRAVDAEFADDLEEALRLAGFDLDATVAAARAALAGREVDRLRAALGKINAIRNSIVGMQKINWSEHIYPLVAALDEAGCVGMGYPAAREYFGTLVERTVAAENERDTLQRELAESGKRREELEALLNAPLVDDFIRAVRLEAAHQVQRWGTDHDAGKEPQDWFWLIGYLAGKALRAAVDHDREKALHHTISTAAVLLNWHTALLGVRTEMQPGHEPSAAIGDSTGRVASGGEG